ncbi:hypothetical protein Mgra_00009881 [Meloidogyne graminicola]|uniref:Uncharacterized protein n=1 Tax=Meloidogyne graminicola TaxID=189291 RepID=A0A8S9ZCW2_9BILA|nr:hypothetical protein Mgra_00009881 [Meloidogyne graminicola]
MISISPINRIKSPNPQVKTNNNEFKNLNNIQSPKRLFDAFCDYTSIAGFRFLHSRHPIWFRILSAIILFGSIGIFIYHSSIYIRRFIDKRNSIQMYTTKVKNITIPNIIICPVRQFRSVLHYDGPPDFLHIVSHYYNSPKHIPIVDGYSINSSVIKAIEFSKNFLKIVNNFENNILNNGNKLNEEEINKLIEKTEKFTKNKTFAKLFPQCLLLMKNDSCFENLINKNINSIFNHFIFIKFVKCRVQLIINLLIQITDRINNFEIYANNTKPSLNEYVVFCTWLDGGPCVLEWIASESGIECAKISGKNKIVASYITLRNDINIVLDLFALDNQLSTWDNRELRIILSGDKNQNIICTNVDGFI